jgi:hypothetical protein
MSSEISKTAIRYLLIRTLVCTVYYLITQLFPLLTNLLIQGDQCRNQPNNLVPLCKFKIIIIHFFRN